MQVQLVFSLFDQIHSVMLSRTHFKTLNPTEPKPTRILTFEILNNCIAMRKQ